MYAWHEPQNERIFTLFTPVDASLPGGIALKRQNLFSFRIFFISELTDNELAFIFEILGSRKTRWQQQQHQQRTRHKSFRNKTERNEKKKLVGKEKQKN